MAQALWVALKNPEFCVTQILFRMLNCNLSVLLSKFFSSNRVKSESSTDPSQKSVYF